MIDFSTLQGLTIPEGVVTQIADASGRVLWKANTIKIIIDYGVVKGTYSSFFKSYTVLVRFDGFPEGYDACTVAIVDGVEYQLTPYAISDTAATYTVEGCDILLAPIGISYDATNGYYCMFRLADGEEHTIMLGQK